MFMKDVNATDRLKFLDWNFLSSRGNCQQRNTLTSNYIYIWKTIIGASLHFPEGNMGAAGRRGAGAVTQSFHPNLSTSPAR